MTNSPQPALPTTPKHKTNKTKKSLVKVVVIDDLGKWTSPNKQQMFFIDEDARFPAITFAIVSDQPPPYSWAWSISWISKISGLRETAKRRGALKTFNDAAKFSSDQKSWTVDLKSQVLGGTLTVTVNAGKESFKRSVFIKGKNPTEEKVRAQIATLSDVAGFEKIVEQESKFKHFVNADHEPVVAFDNGYGMTQMTTPSPSYEQVWSWKENINGGAALYQQKQKLAKAYLGQKGRTYTDEQLKLETWSRWNGGAYHVWDDKTGVWVRNSDIVCDSKTGNIGWNTADAANVGKTEDELHDRDKNSYGNPKKDKTADNKWRYTGECYADHLNAN